jgi:hypothetical protein
MILNLPLDGNPPAAALSAHGSLSAAARHLTETTIQGDTRVVEPHSSAWVPGTYQPPPGAANDSGDLLEAMRTFGEAFTASQAGQTRQGQVLMDEARDVLGSAGIRLVLALLKAGRIPYPDAPWWPVFLSELVRHDPDEPLYVALPPRRPRPAAAPQQPASVSLADEFKDMGLT